jgi:hypothetical protein
MELMAEDVERQKRRQYLEKERAKFTQAQEWLAAEQKDEVDEETEYDYPLPFLAPRDEDDKAMMEV